MAKRSDEHQKLLQHEPEIASLWDAWVEKNAAAFSGPPLALFLLFWSDAWVLSLEEEPFEWVWFDFDHLVEQSSSEWAAGPDAPMILLIDDTTDFPTRGAPLLEACGFRVTSTEDPNQGVQIICRIRPNVLVIDGNVAHNLPPATLSKLREHADDDGMKIIVADPDNLSGPDAKLLRPDAEMRLMHAYEDLFKALARFLV